MELSTVHGLLLLVIGVAIMCYSAQYATLLRPTGCVFNGVSIRINGHLNAPQTRKPENNRRIFFMR